MASAERPGFRAAIVGAAALFFLMAVAYACLEVHTSTDTWIGLACGRQIAESPTFPVADTFSFTAAGRPSYNQNWLTHRIQYWLYANFGPDSVVYAHWAVVFVIQALIAAAAWWRTRSLLAALLTGGVVAFAFRDYLSARSATTGFLCMAATFAMLCALSAGGRKTPWWPLPVLAIAMLVWGQAHGSFTFGFGVVGLFIVQAVLLRLCARGPDSRLMRIPTPHILALIGVLAIGILGAVMLSPFGVENLTHGEKIRDSEIFRHVSEWYPPLGERAGLAAFPPVWRFGVVLGVAGGLLFAAIILRLASRFVGGPTRNRMGAPPPAGLPGRPVVSNLLFDLVILGLTLSMTLWARRFGPVLAQFAGPIVATWIVVLVSSATPIFARIARAGLALAALGGAIALGGSAAATVDERLIAPFRAAPATNLLERFTRADESPLAEIEFLKRNELAGRVFIEWTQAAMVMWHYPDAKVFMDARAQQTYDEDMFLAYVAIDLSEAATSEQILALLDGAAVGNVTKERPPVDIVITRAGRSPRLQAALDSVLGTTWVDVFASSGGFVYLRKDSGPFRKLAERLNAGREWRPDTADALATRGEVYYNMTPPDRDAALACYKLASERDPGYVAKTMPVIMRIEREARRLPALLAYIDAQIQRFSGAVPGLSDKAARIVHGQLVRWRELTVRAMNTASSGPADRSP